MGVGLCRSKMMNGIVALYSSMQKGSTYRNRTLYDLHWLVACPKPLSDISSGWRHQLFDRNPPNVYSDPRPERGCRLAGEKDGRMSGMFRSLNHVLSRSS